MQDYIYRMIEEKNELDDKIRKAKEYLAQFDGQDLDEKTSFLEAQVHAMKTYDFILSQRILLELNEGNIEISNLEIGE